MLSENDVKAELSYAYLHAVAARAGFACKPGGRHDDNAAIDAVVSVFSRLSPDSVLTDFAFDLQLKATSSALGTLKDGRRSFVLPRHQYDRRRTTPKPETRNCLQSSNCRSPVSVGWMFARTNSSLGAACGG